eukprot:NODE_4277_length_813_cov_9.530612_g4119_i0.p1 GENE.NODE_4277_length_813_cov_9.530612_g4119_i0~~NODE_4277_length_813_cov_9.530612_g4119_i0.p1  ORF type:complete len:190 (-),score=70.08 NODE_4277_length_813_cov_9.530612_g4119_i0:90-659(-)
MKLVRVTVMFSDLVNFTSFTEALEPLSLCGALEPFFQILTSEIEARKGTVDKFIGDCVMAFFNAPIPLEDHPAKACEAVLAAQANLKQLQLQENVGEGFILDFRTGIHTGEALVGNFGTSHRLNYTALGDVVNVASRLEGYNKEFGTTILISEDVHQLVAKDFHVQAKGKHLLKGKQTEVQMYTLLGPK